MATVRRLTYESKNSYKDVFTRLRLDVERVATLGNPLLGNLTVDTSKPWVGKIDSSEGDFEILQTNASILPLRFFEGNFFDVFIHGEVSVEDDKTVIDVNLNLGWFYVLGFLLVYFFTIIMTFKFITEGDWEGLKGFTLWILLFNVIPTLLLIIQLKRIENELSDLLGAE